MHHLTKPLGLAAACAVVAIALPALAQKPTAPSGPEGAYTSAAELKAKVATLPASGLLTFDAPASPGTRLMMIRRNKDGEVEVHGEMNDQMIFLEGRAHVQVGGQASGQRVTGPQEWRGGTLTGGKTYEVGPGDTLWIPMGSAHQVHVPAGQEVRYFTVKDNHKPTAP